MVAHAFTEKFVYSVDDDSLLENRVRVAEKWLEEGPRGIVKTLVRGTIVLFGYSGTVPR